MSALLEWLRRRLRSAETVQVSDQGPELGMQSMRALSAAAERSRADRRAEVALHGRDDPLALLGQAAARWARGEGAAIAVTGPDGVGRSALLQRFAAGQPEPRRVVQLRPAACLTSPAEWVSTLAAGCGVRAEAGDVDALLAELHAQQPAIVVIDDAERAMLRAMGCSAVLRTLLTVMLATSHRWLWVVGWREAAWNRAGHVFSLAGHFDQVLALQPVPEEAFAAAFNEARGLALGAEEVRAWHAAASGDLQLALALHELAGNGPAPPRIDYAPLQALDTATLLTVTELLVHGGLTLAEHQAVFQSDAAESRLRLTQLQRLGLVRAEGEEGARRYRVEVVHQAAVTAALHAAHLLY